MLSAQNNPVQPIPQADGNSQPFGEYIRGRQFRSLPDGPVRVHVQKSGPAFDPLRDRPLATDLARSLQMQGLSAVGDVLDALRRKCVSDLVASWTRAVTVLRLDFTSIDIAIGPWCMEHPWARLTDTLIDAQIYAAMPSATVKWVSLDAAIRAFVRHHRNQLAKELDAETNLSDHAIVEDGPTDQSRVAFLRAEMDRLTAFVAGVR